MRKYGKVTVVTFLKIDQRKYFGVLHPNIIIGTVFLWIIGTINAQKLNHQQNADVTKFQNYSKCGIRIYFVKSCLLTSYNVGFMIDL